MEKKKPILDANLKKKKKEEKKFRVGPFNIPEGRVRVITGARVLVEVLERSAQPN